MKIKIHKTDGTTVEAEGTAEECAELIGHRDVKPANVPIQIAAPRPGLPIAEPTYPWWVQPVWSYSTSTVAPFATDYEVGS